MTRGLLVIWRALPTIVPCSAHKLPDLDIHQIPPRQLRLHLLPDLIILVVGLSKYKGSATEIAQFTLGDLAFWAHAMRGEGQDLSGSYRFVSMVDQPTSTIQEVQAKES
jgi:hypothetical protein